MATSDVAICNLALQKLGAARITSLNEDTRNARSLNNCYDMLRRARLRKHEWNFAIKRETLAPDAAAPDTDEYAYQFTLPAGCLRLLPPKRHDLDWQIEGGKILTNDGDTLAIRYIEDVVDTPRFDSCFDEILACDIADHCCEEITQSNTKKQIIMEDRKAALADAKRINAFEKTNAETPEDTWLSARR